MSSTQNVNLRVLLQLFAGMALFGSSTPLSKIIGDAFPVFSASLLRMAIAAIVLAPFAFARLQELRQASRKDWLTIFLIALAGMTGFTATMLFGMRLTSGVIGSTIMSTTPAVTALAAVVFLGAAMNMRKAGALALAIAGVLAINLLKAEKDSASDAVFLGSALVVLAVCFEAAYTLLSKQLSESLSSLSATFAATLLAAPLFFVLALIFDPQPFHYAQADTSAWAAMIFWGAASGGLAPILWYNGVRQSPGALAASFMTVMPVSALLLSYAVLGEPFHWSHLIGFGLVFAGLVLMALEHATNSAE